MKITYIYHSSYLVETKSCYMLFDYFKGELPEISKNKPIYIFSSHSHYDHFNDCVFEIFKDFDAHYILSKDIYKKYDIKNENAICVYANKQYDVDSLKITTLKSTDLGVAYLVCCDGKTIYHSGDLHYWIWHEETKQYNNNMEANYKREIEKIKNIDIDIAFIPVDPRQGDWFDAGIKYVINNLKIKNIFPIHMWDKYEIIDNLICNGYNDSIRIFKINKELDYWEV